MGRIVVAEYLSLDGVMQDPAWTAPYFDEAVGEYQSRSMAEADALLMGRVTYEGMSVAWPSMPDAPGAESMNRLPKYVPTSTLTEPTWNATFLTGDVMGRIRELRDGTGTLLVYGSGMLAEALRVEELIDEYRLMICPIVLGGGKKLFTTELPSTFAVSATQTAPSGMVMLDLTRPA